MSFDAIALTPHMYVVASNAEMLSRTGRCWTFDERADGFVPGEGVGALLLKPLVNAQRDGDHIYGIIRGSGVNQDGKTNGITAPNPQAQTELEAGVYRRFNIDPESIGYIEAHGTGTRLGDPIEIDALTNAFRQFTQRAQFCPIGSVKTNIGHAIAAAGVAGVIKVLLAMKNEQLPPSLNLEQPNTDINFRHSPFYVLTRTQAWPRNALARRAAISSFGFSGTNAHVVIEEPPAQSRRLSSGLQPRYLIPLSAKTGPALQRRIRDLADWLEVHRDKYDLASMSYTLCTGRTHFPKRCAFVADSVDTLLMLLQKALCGQAQAGYFGASDPNVDAADLPALAERGNRLSALLAQGEYSQSWMQSLNELAQAYVDGYEPDWKQVCPPGGRRIPMPTYPFMRERFWVDLAHDSVGQAARYTVAVSADAAASGMKSGSEALSLGEHICVPRWEPTPTQQPMSLPDRKGRALIVRYEGGAELSRLLSVPHTEVFEFVIGNGDERLTASQRRIHPNDAGSFEKALADMPLPDAVYYLADRPDDAPALDDHAGCSGLQELMLIQLFRLIKGLLKQEYASRAISFTLMTKEAFAVLPGDDPSPHLASMQGFIQSVAKECPNWRVTGCDVDRHMTSVGIAKILLDDAGSREPVVWRGRERYLRRLFAVDLEAGGSVPFKVNGVYLIIGGAGDVGYGFSEYLAKTMQARMVWLGRRSLQADHKDAIRNIRALGGEALYLQTDIANPDAMRDAVRQAKAHFGRIDGVIHSAMVFEPTALIEVDERSLRDTLSSKVEGCVSLHAAVADEPLDFLLFFSSGQTFTGNVERAHYAAACQFEDTFAHLIAKQASYPVHVVNWGYWATRRGGEYAHRHKALAERDGAYLLTPEVGVEAVSRLLIHKIPQAMVFHVKPHVRRLLGIDQERTLRQLPVTLGSPIRMLEVMPEPMAEAVQLARAMTELKQFGQYALLDALQRMGGLRDFPVNESRRLLRQRIGLVSHYERLFDALLSILEDAGLIALEGDTVRSTSDLASISNKLAREDLDAYGTRLTDEFPMLVPYVRLIRACTKRYTEILRGQVKATDVMFPDSSMDLVRNVYTGNAFANYSNDLVAQAVTAYLDTVAASATPARKIRILEIGAGTGGTTAVVLERIARHGPLVEYVYSDISLAFTQHGKREYGARYPFMDFRTLNIELPLGPQDFAAGAFDVVIASNVLHATRDVRRTLARVKQLLGWKGWLVLNELTHAHVFSTLTFGLLDGWWLFDDGALRLPFSPLLDSVSWRQLLGEQGFGKILLRGCGDQSGLAIGQTVFVAESDGLAVVDAVEAPARKQDAASQTFGDLGATDSSSLRSDRRDTNLAQSREPILAESNASSRRDVVSSMLADIAATVLQIPVTAIESKTPLMDMGFDSLLTADFAKRICSRLGVDVVVTDLFDHATVERLADYICEKFPQRMAMPQFAAAASSGDASETGGMAQHAAYSGASDTDRNVGSPGSEMDIAVVGVAAQFADAKDVGQFWANLAAGRDGVKEITRWPLNAFFNHDGLHGELGRCKHGGLLDDIDVFDPLFFSLSPKQAEMMEPRQRLFLQEAWKALEDAGLNPHKLSGHRCGVFVGCEGSTDYFDRVDRQHPELGAEYFLGNSNAILAARIAYLLDLKGPTVTIDTACSSSLVALHAACESLRRGECDMALAGGAMVRVQPDWYVLLSRMGMLSPQGKCRAFDHGADGFVPAEGAGAVVLKPLSAALQDGSHIYGVIKGSGINQDGKTNGIMAPSAISQQKLALDVYRRFRIDPATISYVEAHGTGTALGDPIEFQALKSAFSQFTHRKQFCGLGSVKTNIGHAGAAAGLAGVIKVLMALRHRQLPPSLHFEKTNPQIDFGDSPFYVVTNLQPWLAPEGIPRRAAVSSFGHSGTNAHVVIEEPPVLPGKAATQTVLVPLSGKTEPALRRRARDLLDWIAREGDRHSLADVAFTLQVGRAHFPYRLAFTADGFATLSASLRQWLEQGAAQDCAYGAPQGKGLHNAPQDDSVPYVADHALARAARNYVEGGEPDWASLWPEYPMRLVAMLPAYPFEQERYWLPEAMTGAPLALPPAANVTPGQTGSISLVRLDHADEDRDSSFILEASELSWARHYRLHEQPILPAALVFEIARSLASNNLQSVTWNRPLRFDERCTNLETGLYSSVDGREIEIGLYRDDGSYEIFAQGTINPDLPAALPFGESLPALSRRCLTQSQSADWAYRQLKQIGIEVTPGFRSIAEWGAWNGTEALGRLQLAQDSRCPVFTALLDGALQSVLLLAASSAPAHEECFMPFAVETVRCYGQALPERCWVYVQQTGQEAEGLKCYDLWLLDEQERVLVEFKGYAVKALKGTPGTGAADGLEDGELLALFDGLQRGEIELEAVAERMQKGAV